MPDHVKILQVYKIKGCQLESEGFFELDSLDIEFDYSREERSIELNATLVELSLSGISGFMVLMIFLNCVRNAVGAIDRLD